MRKKKPREKFKITIKSSSLPEEEKRINQLVYKLYCLVPEEIKIIEKN